MREAMLGGFLIAGLAAGCAGDPAVVYVAAEGFRESVTVRTSRGLRPSVAAGEPLVLYATRTSGPWRRAPRDTAVRGDCWRGSLPSGEEPEVAASLRWLATPDSGVRFNVQFRDDLTREVRFSYPGSYVLRSESNWCGARYFGNEIRVTVTPP